MLASTSRASLKRVHSRVSSSFSHRVGSSLPQSTAQHWWKNASTQASQQKPIQDEFTPSPHLIASRQRLPGFQGDTEVQKARTRSTPARLTMDLMQASDKGKYRDCLDIAAQMKALNIPPTLATYTALINAAANDGRWLDGWAILDDMISVGVKPDVAVFSGLLKAQNRCNSQFVWQVVGKMNELSIAPNANIFSSIIRRFLYHDNIELAVQYFYSMKERKIIPEVQIAQSLVADVAQFGYPRLALDLATWFEEHSIRRLDHTIWVRCLIASGEALYTDGVVSCWTKVVHELKMKPGEAICLSVLDTAARSGLPDLATDVLRVMKLSGIQWREYHFAPLIEAFCHDNQFKEAFQTLDIMRTTDGLDPLPETAYPITDAITDTETLDSAWATVEALQKDGTNIDVVVLQALIKASVKLGDLQRAIGTYKSLADYGVSADLIIFNLLLQGCVSATHRTLGDLLLADMKAAKIKPDQDTYESFISLCLTQDDYEDAFFYLEEMKAAQFHPSQTIYETLVEKCIVSSDPRFKVALEELQDQGYKPSPELRHMVRTALGQESSVTSKERDTIALDPVAIDGAARRFIETGGVEGTVELPKEQIDGSSTHRNSLPS